MQSEPHEDPLEDTHAGRGPERDNPLDGAGTGVFGAAPETIGVPNVTGRGHHPPTPDRDRPGWPRWALSILIGLLLVVLGSSAALWLF